MSPLCPRPKNGVSDKSFRLLASPTIQTLNTWTEVLPKAEALVAEVLAIDGGQQDIADKLLQPLSFDHRFLEVRRRTQTTWNNAIGRSSLEASLVMGSCLARVETRFRSGGRLVPVAS